VGAIVSQVEIAGSPAEVFSYVTDPKRFTEWQENIVDGYMEGGERPSVGSKCTTTRRIGGRERVVNSEVTEISPPRTWSVHGIDGPIRSTVNVTVEPLDGAQSRVTIELDFEGHGIGRLLVPLVVRRQARQEMQRNMSRLKARLESAG
jgi:uncharacterized protein YndB with AHSA1/START domain